MIVVIAGQGALPEVVVRALGDRPHQIYALEGFAPETLAATPVRIEHVGSFIAQLVAQGADQICFAGRVARPPLDPSAIDAATMPLVPRMMQALGAGDDAALRTLLSFFEEAGITPVAAQDLVPDLVLPAGVVCGTPSPRDTKDLARARAVHAALSGADVGQGVVVAAGQVLAVEALPGTDWMLRSLRDQGYARPDGGLFFKAPKIGQDRRVDLPTIGVATIKGVAAAGLSGLVIEADGVLVLDQPAVLEAAQEAGLFLWVHALDTDPT